MFKKININTVSFIMGPLFYFLSLNYLIYFDFLNSLFLFVIASLVFPPSFKKIRKELKISNNYDFDDFLRLAVLIILFLSFSFLNQENIGMETNKAEIIQKNKTEENNIISKEKNNYSEKIPYQVSSVIDGDTIKVLIEDEIKTIRLIGIDSPETVHPERKVECFGREASLKLKELLEGKKVFLKSDSSQDDLDKYGRLLRYVYLEDETLVNKFLIENGYAHEYTYLIPYQYQEEFKEAELNAKANNIGLWDTKACQDFYPEVKSDRNETCLIKGNISYLSEEKIYHLPDCNSYQDTIVNESKGERWFCSEEEAINAGWRIAENCIKI